MNGVSLVIKISISCVSVFVISLEGRVRAFSVIAGVGLACFSIRFGGRLCFLLRCCITWSRWRIF